MQDRLQRRLLRLGYRLLLHVLGDLGHPVDGGQDVVDQGVDQGVGEEVGASPHRAPVVLDQPPHRIDAVQRHGVVAHDEVGAQEEGQLRRLHDVRLGRVVDAVDDDEQVIAEVIDLR